MSRFQLLLPIILLFGCASPTSTKQDSTLAKIVDERIAVLDNNFKYNVLVSSGNIIDYNALIGLTKELKNKQGFTKLNEELLIWADSLNVSIPILNRETLNKDLDLALIILLDELIIRTLNSSNNFSDLEPIVFLEQENDSIAFYYVVLHARDSLFVPEVLLELSTGTFPILVDEQTGIARFSMRKKNKNEKKSFKGKVIYPTDVNTQEIRSFEYPRELIGERD